MRLRAILGSTEPEKLFVAVGHPVLEEAELAPRNGSPEGSRCRFDLGALGEGPVLRSVAPAAK